MGYDLHITRKADWSDEDGPAITREEFERVVLGDAAFRRDPDDPDFANWVRANMERDGGPWLRFTDGNLQCKNPPGAEFISEMVRVARELGGGAKVVGDDGEEYGPDGNPVPDGRGPAPERAPRAGAARHHRKLLFWLVLGPAIAAIVWVVLESVGP